jgi:hypothetical protein
MWAASSASAACLHASCTAAASAPRQCSSSGRSASQPLARRCRGPQVSVPPRPEWSNVTYFTSLTGVKGNRTTFEKHEFLGGRVEHPSKCLDSCSGRGLCTSIVVPQGKVNVTVHRCWCMQVGASRGHRLLGAGAAGASDCCAVLRVPGAPGGPPLSPADALPPPPGRASTATGARARTTTGAWRAAAGAASACAASATAARPTTGWAASRAGRSRGRIRCSSTSISSISSSRKSSQRGAGSRSTCTTCPGRLPSRTATTQVRGLPLQCHRKLLQSSSPLRWACRAICADSTCPEARPPLPGLLQPGSTTTPSTWPSGSLSTGSQRTRRWAGTQRLLACSSCALQAVSLALPPRC